MRISTVLPVVVRILVGALFVFSGSNKLVPFMDMPPFPPQASAFLAALAATGYMMTLLGAVEVVFGGLLILGRFVPLALTVLAPIVVNIFLFHVLLDPAPAVPTLLVAAEIYLAWVYREAFLGLLQPTPRPAEDARAATVRERAALVS